MKDGMRTTLEFKIGFNRLDEFQSRFFPQRYRVETLDKRGVSRHPMRGVSGANGVNIAR